MIVEKDGRSRSIRTVEEDLAALKKDMDTLTPEERETLEHLLAEFEQPPADDKPTILQFLTEQEYKTAPVDMRTFIKDPYFLGNTCDNLYPKLLDDLIELFEGGYHEVIYSGCIELDAIIQSSNGSLRSIREWLGTHGSVVGFDPAGPAAATTGIAKHSGVLPVVRMTLANGMTQRLTPDHRVMVWRGGYEWVPVGELAPGDFVVVPRQLQTTPDSTLTVDEAKLLAYWCGDGSSSNQRSRFCDGNPATSLEVVDLLKKLGFAGTREPKGANCWEVYVSEHKRSGFRAWLLEHEGAHLTADVVVPDSVCRASNAVVSAFLNRLWACEGCVYVNPGKSPPRFNLGMTSERFIRQVQLLLLRFGILSRIYFTPQFDKRSGITTETWTLSVTGVGPITRMLEAVGPILGKEAACQRAAAYCAATKENTNVDVIPLLRKQLSKEMVQRGLVRKASLPWWSLSNGGGYLSRQAFSRWLGEFGNTELGQELSARFPSSYSFEHLVEIAPDGEAEVGDICDVSKIQSFISNGIYSHNSIGWGKTFTASIGIARILYELSCLKDPHKTYGLAKDTNISVVCLSVNETLATKVVFENISTKIKASPYFQESFPFEATKKELRFPNNVWVAARATTDTSALGLNTISGLVDETNFMPTKGKSHDRFGYIDHAEVIYNAIKRRMKSRFEKKGKLPGMLFVVSSKKTMDDFTARRIRESQNDASVFVRDYALWDVKPEDYYSAKKFWVIVGNEQTPSRILANEAEAKALAPKLPEGVVLIDVPEDFRPDFERDLEGAIRDLAGCATVAISPFIQRREKIIEAIDPAREHPFSVQIYDPSRPGAFLWNRMVHQVQERDVSGAMVQTLRPIINPRAARHLHIDPSVRGDATGIAMAHIAGWRDVRRRNDDGIEFLERAPLYIVDFVLRVVPPVGDEIVLGDMRRLVYDLTAHGYMITSVTYDSFQSVDALQQLQQRGYNASLISVDTSMDPYENLKTALYEGRLALYHYEPLIRELQQLERDSKRRKVDHPPKGSKDVADALAACLHTLSLQRSTQPLPMLRGTAYYSDDWMSEQREVIQPGGTSPQSDFRGGMPLPILSSGGRGGNGNDGWG